MSGELRSIFKTHTLGRFVGYHIFKYEEKDHEHHNCVVAGIPLGAARLYKTKLLDKEQTNGNHC